MNTFHDRIPLGIPRRDRRVSNPMSRTHVDKGLLELGTIIRDDPVWLGVSSQPRVLDSSRAFFRCLSLDRLDLNQIRTGVDNCHGIEGDLPVGRSTDLIRNV